MAVIETWFDQELKEPVKVHHLNGNVFSMDNGGNLIGINVFDEGQPATLGGTVSANIIRADGATVTASGTLSGNKCSVTLPQSAYAVPGLMAVIIKLTNSGTVTTVGAVSAVCYRSSTDTAVDPGTIIPSVETLISEIETAVASIPADYSTLWASTVPTFSTSKNYEIGEKVSYDGKAYQFITYHAAGSWNADHVRQISVGEELYRTQSEINASGVIVTPFWARGSLNSSGAETTSTTRLRSEYIELKDNLWIEVKEGFQYEIDYYDLSEGTSFLGLDGWLDGFNYAFKPDATHVRILLKHAAGGTITLDKCNNIAIGYGITNLDMNRAESHRYIYRASGATTGQIRPDVESAKIRVVPIEPGHIYNVFVHGGNRRLFGLSNNPDPVIGEEIPFAETFTSDLTADKVFRFTNGDYRFLYAYYQYGEYSGDLFEIEVQDISRLNLNEVNVYKGWGFVSSTGAVHRAADEEMCVIPLQTNTDYTLFITGGNRRRVGLSNDPYPIESNLTSILLNTSSSADTRFGFNSGSYAYCYVYYYTNSASQTKPGNVVLELGGNEKNTISESFTASAITLPPTVIPNTGDAVSVMSYNLFRYQVDTGSLSGMPDSKVLAFRKFLGHYNPDFICGQECGRYIDTSETKECTEFLFYPNYPYVYNSSSWSNANIVASKIQAGTSGRVKYTDGGSSGISVEYATFTIGSKTLLVCSSHITWKIDGQTADSTDSIARRLSNYTELFKWVNGLVTMPKLSDSSAVTVPTHSHCIIGMDANSLTASDKSSLISLAGTYGMKLGNGGRLGWFLSSDIGTDEAESLDNIVVSDNIFINNIEALSSEYANLYSDHVPLLANLTLT